VSNPETRSEAIEKEWAGATESRPDDLNHLNLLNVGNKPALPTPADASSLKSGDPADDGLPLLQIETAGKRDGAGDSAGLDSPESRLKQADCVDSLMDKLGVSMDLKTDPEMLKDILHNDMKLDDCPAVQKILGARLSEAESMKPMLEKVRESIITKQPEIHDFIATALKENLIPPPDAEGHRQIVRSLNHMVILDAVTKAMADDPKVMEKVRDHILNKRKQMGIRSDLVGSFVDIYKAEDDLFGPVKAKSVDVGIDMMLGFRKHGHVDRSESRKLCTVLGVNIAEAVAADLWWGFPRNAGAGAELDLHPASKVWVSGDNRTVNFNHSQAWASLYESWNMAFVTNCSNPQFFFPKLLIPQVIDAKPEEYIFNRAIALWLAVNFHLFNRIEKKPLLHLPHNEEIARRWGEINLDYGKKLGREQKETVHR
jgi:hypothetical protein